MKKHSINSKAITFLFFKILDRLVLKQLKKDIRLLPLNLNSENNEATLKYESQNFN